jgi:diketogulonate reductase-like aldo/keto reductase
VSFYWSRASFSADIDICSNYGVKHIQELMAKYPDSPPSMNQIELSPFFQRKSIVKECYKHNIAIESYSPLGKGAFIDLPELKEIGKVGFVYVVDLDSFLPRIFQSYGKTPAHILIRWCLQSGYIVLPKSANPQRIEANADVYDFELVEKDMKKLNEMETGQGITWWVLHSNKLNRCLTSESPCRDPTKAP